MTLFYIFLGVVFIVVIVMGIINRRKGEEVWRQLAREIGGEYIDGNFLRSGKVQGRLRGMPVLLDTYSVPAGDSSTNYTRLRAALQDPDGLQFYISRRSLTNKIDKWLGSKEISIGDPNIDHDFVIKGNHDEKIRALFRNPSICRLIQAQRSLTLTMNEIELKFETTGVIRDEARLRSFFELFKEIMIQLGV